MKALSIPMKPYPAQWWHLDSVSESSGDEKTLVCELCPRQCHMAEGKAGYCFARQNHDGQLVSAVYGRSTGFCIDPIEKKPLYHFLPGTPTLSFGTIGCNLCCSHCQNWQTSRCRSPNALVERATPDRIAGAARQLECSSVSLTYNEPIVWAEYAVATARACRKQGVKTVAVTNGYIQSEPAKWFFEHIDAANVDLKSFRDPFYRNIAGGALQPVLDTLVYLAKQTRVWLEITNLVIPGENDASDELKELCDWIVTELGDHIPLHFSAFHPAHRLLHRPPTDAETLLRAHGMARSCGLRHVYLGNLASTQHQATYCGQCGFSLFERNGCGTIATGVSLPAHEGDDAACRRCNEKLAGRFSHVIGTWGNRRQAIRLGDFSQENRG
ncbi:MAG: AmmeMemoRadiSam system radical SAM enzyme [Planctomycetaceae bacterium]|nr:AmmeMemoRadiSam system radical SAM enzyme [Planctomycetaceae bacterium]